MPPTQSTQTLSNVPLFEGLTQEQLADVARRVRRRTFEPREYLVRRDEIGDAMYILLSGKVKVSTLTEVGQTETIVATLSTDDIIGELSVLDGERRSADVIAIERTEALVLSAEDVRAWVHAFPAVGLALLRTLAGRVRRSTEWISVLCSQDVSGRLARVLLDLSRMHGVDLPGGGRMVRLHLTQNDLGSLVGASRESVNKAISSFKEVKWIAPDDKPYITILNREALERRGG